MTFAGWAARLQDSPGPSRRCGRCSAPWCCSHGAEPLPALYARLTALARAHGPIRDDETVLLLRRDA